MEARRDGLAGEGHELRGLREGLEANALRRVCVLHGRDGEVVLLGAGQAKPLAPERWVEALQFLVEAPRRQRVVDRSLLVAREALGQIDAAGLFARARGSPLAAQGVGPHANALLVHSDLGRVTDLLLLLKVEAALRGTQTTQLWRSSSPGMGKAGRTWTPDEDAIIT